MTDIESKSFVVRLWRAVFPEWEKRWCVVTSAVNPDWHWMPYECWYRNGEVDIRYAFLLVMPSDDEDHAKEIAIKFNEISERYNTRLRSINNTTL